MRIFLSVIISTLLLQAAVANSDFDLVKTRVVDNMKGSVDQYRVEQLIQTMRDDGSWPGIDYQDLSRTGFQHYVHLSNLVTLSRAYHNERTKYYHSNVVVEAVNRALAFWCENDFICENWWHNQINTPKQLVSVLLLMDNRITPQLRSEALRISSRANMNAGGARPGGDRVKIAGIVAEQMLAKGDEEQFAGIMEVISNELKFTTGSRGLQHDFSFHHRSDRVNNTLSYGSGFASAFAEWAYYVRGTQYAFSQEKVEQLVDYFLDGMVKQCIYGIYKDWNVMNRDVSREESFRPRSSALPRQLLEVTDYRAEELREVVLLREGRTEPTASFAKFFWQTEHFVFQRPEFFTSVRMYSTRNKNMEQPYNSEGLKNHHKADGSNFLSLTGDEYDAIWPIYDWQKIPGSTVMQKAELPPPGEIQKYGLTNFVGAVTDGLYGAVAFDFMSPHDMVKAHKSWFFFDDAYVCLGAGIEAPRGGPVATTLNQCWLRGDVVVKDAAGKRTLDQGVHALQDVQWVHHDQVGYWFPGMEDVFVSDTIQSGSWYDISEQWDTPREQIEQEVFKAWIDHGRSPQGMAGFGNEITLPQDAVYQYIVMPSVTVSEMEMGPEIEILANNRTLHAVRNKEDGMVQAVFYSSASLGLSEGDTLTADSPGAVILKMDGDRVTSLSVADPSRLLGKFHLTITGEIPVLQNPAQEEELEMTYDAESGKTHLAISLPGGFYAGSSRTIEFK